MTAQQAIEKIHSLDKFGSRPGLDRIRRFLDILGNPQDSLRFVHVAGTNGKGSTCALLSSVLVEAGYKTALIPEAWVWHKRRTDFCKFFRQVYNSGIARINLEKRHPGTLKLVHLLPTVFSLGVIGLLLCTAILLFLVPCLSLLALSPIVFYCLIICIDSSILNKSLQVGLLSIPAAFTQLMGYGFGFIESWWKRSILKQDEFTAFEKNFYK